jgi:hypothetical protein
MKLIPVSVKVIPGEPLPPPPKTYQVTLNLSEKDARSIMSLCWLVSGSDKYSTRHVMDKIHVALRTAGLESAVGAVGGDSRVHFRDYSDYS